MAVVYTKTITEIETKQTIHRTTQKLGRDIIKEMASTDFERAMSSSLL